VGGTLYSIVNPESVIAIIRRALTAAVEEARREALEEAATCMMSVFTLKRRAEHWQDFMHRANRSSAEAIRALAEGGPDAK